MEALIKNLLEKGLTQKEIATLAGISPSSISRVKTGKTKSLRYAVGLRLQKLNSALARGSKEAVTK